MGTDTEELMISLLPHEHCIVKSIFKIVKTTTKTTTQISTEGKTTSSSSTTTAAAAATATTTTLTTATPTKALLEKTQSLNQLPMPERYKEVCKRFHLICILYRGYF